MAGLRIAIAPDADVQVPEDLPVIVADLAYSRKQDPDVIKRVPDLAQILPEAIRITLDSGLHGTAELQAWAPGTAVELRLLGPAGDVRVSKTATGPEGKPLTFVLTADDVAQATAPLPQPVPGPGSVDRRAVFVPVGDNTLTFVGCRLLVAPVVLGDGNWPRLGLDKVLHAEIPVSAAVPWRDPLPSALGSAGWVQQSLSVDGQFGFSVPLGSGDAWLWLLSGSVGAFGAVLDDLSAARVTRMSVALPPVVVVSTGPVQTPTPDSDAEVAQNPGIFAEDPGEFCRPFTSPERVLGERSYFVVLRAEQPLTSAEASVVIDPLPTVTVKPPLRASDVSIRSAVLGAVESARAALPAAGAVLRDETASFYRHALPDGYQDLLRGFPRGRSVLDASHPIQWEGDISRYQATTVARGHILEYRMRWRSNRYSLGTVAKTLTLAARQTVRIQKIEFFRAERSRRQEETQLRDQVSDTLARERDYDDSVQANLSEWARGESEASTSAAAGGVGFAAAGFVIGGGGAASNASSSASQEGGRRTSAAEEQRLRDSIRRYGDARRKLDSLVVNEITQEETVTGTTEVVRNVNYGHSLTVIYYQILRHLKVETSVAGVRECLFVPFAITPFNVARAYRWRDPLRSGLRDPGYAEAMTHLKDVLTGFAQSDVPPGRRSDQPVRNLSGSIFLRLAVERPHDNDDGTFDPAAWALMRSFLSVPALGIYRQLQAIAEAQREAAFQTQHAPGIAAGWANTMQLQVGAIPIAADFTLATQYRFNSMVRVDFTARVPGGTPITRETLANINVRATRNLPPGSVANLQNLSVTYDTDQFRRTFTSDPHADDLVDPETGAQDAAGAAVTDVPDMWERQDVRAEMTRAVQNLIEHLNNYVEYYTKFILWSMDRDRLFMLIDGFYVPGTSQVSIASVVERDPIAIIGNAMVFRVSAGSFLGLGDIKTPQDLLNYYVGQQAPSEPMLIALPTDGLYAQTVMDECAAVEEHYGSTDWVLNDPDPALGEIAPELLASRRAEPAPATPTPLPQTLINLQNAPEAPAPSGLASALNAVTDPNAFRDLTGLAGTQANAAAALQTAANLASSFGAQAAALKMADTAAKAHAAQTADQKLASVQRAADKQIVTPADAQRHANQVLEELHNPSSPPRPFQDPVLSQAILAASGQPGSTIQTTTPDGQVMVSLASTGTGGPAPAAATPATPPAEVASWPLGVDLYAGNEYKKAPISAAGFANLKSHGKVFAILKSSQGTNPDGQFITGAGYYQRAADAGLIRGSYHFFANKNAPAGTWGGTVAQQADKVIGLVRRLGPGDLAPALDLEDERRNARGKPDSAGRYPLDQGLLSGQTGYHYRTTQAGKDALIADAQDFLDRVETALGRTPIIYTSSTWMDSDELNNPTALSSYPLWTVNHERTAQLVDIAVGGWGKNWDLLQYAEDGGTYRHFGTASYSEPGIDIPGCDFDAYHGSLAGLRGLADLGRPAAAMTSAVSYVAHAEAYGSLHLRTGPSWADHNLGAAELFGIIRDPDMLASGNDAFLYYVRDGRVREAHSQSGAPWHETDIDDGTAAFSNPRAVTDGTARHIAYWGEDDDWHLLSWNGAWTKPGGVLSLAGIKTAAGGSASGQPVPYITGGVVHLVGRAGLDGHLHDVWQEAGTWRHDDLTQLGRDLASAMPAATYAPAVGSANGAALIVFRGVRGDLWAISRSDNAPVNLTQTTSATGALGHPACVTLNGTEPHIVFRGTDRLIHDIWLESGQWHVQDVCADTAAADPAATTDGATAIVAIRTTDNDMHVARYDGGWTCTATPRMSDGLDDTLDGGVLA